MDTLLLCSGDPEGIHLIVGYECRHCGESLRAIARVHKVYALRKDPGVDESLNFGVLGYSARGRQPWAFRQLEKEKRNR